MEINYQKLKFKCGLEIHQQLDSNKLFCRCPSVLRKDKPDFEVKRKLHAVSGESGEIDIATQYQASLKKEFTYQGYDTTCLVELDEEPPYEINEDALEIALHICHLIKCKILPITQIMRKMVVDGSNTSGFQRTLLLGEDGHIDIPTSNEKIKQRIGIKYIYLEEDSARIVSPNNYRLDRLGTPLVEIVTEPEIKNPEQAKKVALKIGEILRSCQVKRGIGTIRQDVNVSIRDENRVEIKGMQDMDIFTDAIDNEISRQKQLSDSGKPVQNEVRKVLKDASTKYLRPLPNSARMYPETDLPLLRIPRNTINKSKKTTPKLISSIKGNLKKKGLNEEMIKLLFKRNKTEEFTELCSILDKPDLVSKMILVLPNEISKNTKKSLQEISEKLTANTLISVLELVRNKKISEAQVKEVLQRITSGIPLKEAIKFEKIDLSEIEEKIMKTIKEKPNLSENAYMGLAMGKLGLKGKVSGKEIIEIIQKYVK